MPMATLTIFVNIRKMMYMGQRSIRKQGSVNFVGRRVFVMKLAITVSNVDPIIAIVPMRCGIVLPNM
jgi:hypothetical protein